MISTISYPVKITNAFQSLLPTLEIYRSCTKKLIDVVIEHYSEIKDLSKNEAQRHIEKLVHSTAQHKAIYPFFDKDYYKFPSYLRRSAISEAIRIVSSYMAAVEQWEHLPKEQRGKRPRMNRNQRSMPALYKGNCFRWLEGNRCQIKVYYQNDWVWRTYSLAKTDMEYINRISAPCSCPILEKRGHRFYLRLSFRCNSELQKQVDAVCGVDLGVNTSAVCSIIRSDGTVTARSFIDFPVEKDRMKRVLGEIRKAQQQGATKTRRLWRFVNYYNRELSIKTAREIVHFAKNNHAQCIVFEHLGPFKKGNGSQTQRLALWRKNDIQRRAEALAHRLGMHIAYVNARNTSKLAFDGSGIVRRDHSNRQLCTFQNGKQYNCDLSASYNIGSRYLIKQFLKTLSATEELTVSAKVPELVKRTGGLTTIHSTLSTLINLNAALTPCEFAG